MNPLQDLHIVITRPQAQARQWQQQLQVLGATTYLLPVMEIVPLTDKEQRTHIKTTAKQLANYHIIIFVSQNAVAFAQQFFGLLPPHLKIFAIGSATATALRRAGLAVESASEAMNSEDLLSLPSLQSVGGKSILICRGVGGRETLAGTLRERGAKVEYCELYQRQPHPQAAQLLAALPWKHLIQTQDKSPTNTVVSAHSGESVQWLSDLLDKSGDAVVIKHWPLLVPGERVQNIAQGLGFTRILVSKNASDKEMSQALANWWQQHG